MAGEDLLFHVNGGLRDFSSLKVINSGKDRDGEDNFAAFTDAGRKNRSFDRAPCLFDAWQFAGLAGEAPHSPGAAAFHL